jgi:hypothetical protein
MAASSFIYDSFKGGLAIGTYCYWSSTTASYYILLVSNNYVPDESHSYASAFSGAELSSTSFTAGFNGTGRISLTGRVLTINNTSHQAEFNCNTVTWSGLSAGVAHAFVVIQQTTSDGLSRLVTYNSLGGFPITTNGTNFTLSFTSAGIMDAVDV